MIGGEHSKKLELFGRQRSAPCQCNVVNACRNAGLQAITKTYKNRTYFFLGHNMSITQKNVFIVLNAQVLLHFGVSAIRLYLCHRLAKQSGELSLGKIAKQSHSVRQNYV
jgi:hypothetical protein